MLFSKAYAKDLIFSHKFSLTAIQFEICIKKEHYLCIFFNRSISVLMLEEGLVNFLFNSGKIPAK